jgi:hypothetical protein
VIGSSVKEEGAVGARQTAFGHETDVPRTPEPLRVESGPPNADGFGFYFAGSPDFVCSL